MASILLLTFTRTGMANQPRWRSVTVRRGQAFFASATLGTAVVLAAGCVIGRKSTASPRETAGIDTPCSVRRRQSPMVCWPITPAGSVPMPSGRVPPLRFWVSENSRNGHFDNLSDEVHVLGTPAGADRRLHAACSAIQRTG